MCFVFLLNFVHKTRLCQIRVIGYFVLFAHTNTMLILFSVYAVLCFCAGDIFEISVYKTWEFQPNKPIRSMFLPCLLLRPVYSVLDLMSIILTLMDGPQILSTYTLLVAPRLVMLVMSTFTDVVVYKQAKLHKSLDVDFVMFLHTSSYIALVHYTRILTNTVEAFLFMLLVYIVQKDIKRIERIFRKYPRSKLTRTTRHEHPAAFGPIDWYDVENVFTLATVMVVGFFNRPTFLFFAFMPLSHWLLDGNYPQTFKDWKLALPFLFAGVKLLVRYAMPAMAVIIMWDSLYYSNPVNWEIHAYSYSALLPEITKMVVQPVTGFLNFFTVTPYNFLRYNLKHENLAQHGLHPYHTHFFANQLMLFGPLIIVLYVALIRALYRYLRYGVHIGGHFKDLKPFLYAYIFSLLLFSVFPHQESRFIIPLLHPIIMIYAFLTFGNVSRWKFKMCWIIFNFLGCLFYGTLHQGGVVSSVQLVHQWAKELPKDATMHVIYSHTYMPPKHLFMIAKPPEPEKPRKKRPKATEELRKKHMDIFNNFFLNNQSALYIPYAKLKVYDLKGQPMTEVENLLDTISKSLVSSKDKILVIAPATYEQELCDNSRHYQYLYVDRIAWHLSMENPPIPVSRVEVQSLCSCLHEPCPHIRSLEFQMSLNVYEVQSKSNFCYDDDCHKRS